MLEGPQGHLLADFFTYEPPAPFSHIYDATFLCSLPPARRGEWAACMRRLLRPGGELVLDLFPVAEYEGGPPFALSLALVRTLLEPHGFRCVHEEEVAGEHKARPLFRGASDWLVRWVREPEEAEPEEELSMC